MRVSDYGATLVSLWVKDAQLDAVLGFDQVEGYQQSVKYMGAMIGRVAAALRTVSSRSTDRFTRFTATIKAIRCTVVRKGLTRSCGR
ncbi:MAG: hypothetical protein ACLSFJ_00330 [Holdemania filiformis]